MPITEALKKLIKTITGKNAVGETIEELVTNLNENYPEGSGGGGSLPEPGNVGNVMTSTGTGWESAAPSGGLAFTLSLGESITCDVAVADIVDALDSNTPVFGMAGDVGELTIKKWDTELNKVTVLLCIYEGEKTTTIEFVGESGTPDTWTYESFEVNGVPEVSASDNGKILGVENGGYALTEQIYEVVLTPTGSGEYTAAHNGSAVTVAEVMQAAANRNAVITTVDNGVTVIMPVSSVDTASNNLTFGAVVCAVSGQSLVERRYYGIGLNDGTNDVWGMDAST